MFIIFGSCCDVWFGPRWFFDGFGKPDKKLLLKMMMKVYAQSRSGLLGIVLRMPSGDHFHACWYHKHHRALATNQKSLKWKTLISSAYSVTQKNLGFSKTKSEKFKFSFCKQKLKNVWKLLKMSHLNFWILAFSANFCPIKTDLSGNTVWPQASGFQKLAKMDHFWHF